MAWLRENDDEASDPKILRLIEHGGWEAYYRVHQLRQWCAMHETGGSFTGATARALGTKGRHLRAMVSVGLVDDEGDGVYKVHNWRRFNPDDPTAAARQRRSRSRKRHGGSHGESHGGSHGPSRNSHGDTSTGTGTNPIVLPISRTEAVAEEHESTASDFKIPDLLREIP